MRGTTIERPFETGVSKGLPRLNPNPPESIPGTSVKRYDAAAVEAMSGRAIFEPSVGEYGSGGPLGLQNR